MAGAGSWAGVLSHLRNGGGTEAGSRGLDDEWTGSIDSTDPMSGVKAGTHPHLTNRQPRRARRLLLGEAGARSRAWRPLSQSFLRYDLREGSLLRKSFLRVQQSTAHNVCMWYQNVTSQVLAEAKRCAVPRMSQLSCSASCRRRIGRSHSSHPAAWQNNGAEN
jgi:hypothetical protein